jgi:uncharacterized protein YggU (UPF0235/DUF167 family)
MFLKVKVFPNSKNNEIIKKDNNHFEIKVKEKAQRGLANIKVREILAQYLNIPKQRLILIKGKVKQNKIFKLI